MRMLFIAIFAVASGGAAAGEFAIDCPDRLPPSGLRLVDPPQGWQGTVNSPLFLHNAEPTDGPPQDLGRMIGEAGKSRKNAWVTRYPLTGDFSRGKWFTCDYGSLNEVSLSRRLPNDTKECTVIGRLGELAGQNQFQIVCRN
jgi:hypothetical protein